MSRNHPEPLSDEDEEDEETLQLKLQAIEARLKLKKFQKAKKAAEDGDIDSLGALSRPGTAVSARRTELPRPRSEVQVPVSPVRTRRKPEEQRSPARVLLGIDKGLKAQDVSLKRASSYSGRNTNGRLLQTSSAQAAEPPKIKSFSKRIAESRNKEKEREEKQARIDKSRSGGFGLGDIEGLKDRPASRAASSLSSGSRNSENTAAAVKNHVRSWSTNNLQASATSGPGSKGSRTLDASRTQSAAPRPSSRGFGASSTAAKYAEISQRDDSTDAPSFESFSSLHLKSREMQHNAVTRTLEGKTIVTIPQLLKTVKAPEYEPPDMENDFVVMGIIAAKSSPMATKNAVKQRSAGNQDEDAHATNKFMVITLTDLKWELQLFLFDTGFSKYWKLTPGTLIAILNPDILPPRDRGSTKFSLKLTSSDDTVLEIGSARDLDFCHAMRKDGKECGQWIDGRKTEFCDFHIELQVEKSKRGRMEVNTMGGFGKGPSGSNKGTMFGKGRGKGDELKREGRYHDAFLHETMYIAPGAGSAARLMDRDEQPYHVTERAEKHRKQLAAKEKERALAKRLGDIGSGAGSEYMKRATGSSTSQPSSRVGTALDDPFVSQAPTPTDVLSLLTKKAEDVDLSRGGPAKRKRAISSQSITSSSNSRNEPVGWSGSGKRGLLLPGSPTKKDPPSSFRGTRPPSPAKKKARLLLDGKGIREPGRDSLGTMDVGLIAAMDDDDDLEVTSGPNPICRTTRVPDGLTSRTITRRLISYPQHQARTRSSFPTMASTPPEHDNKIYALIDYEDAYVQPLLLAALKKHISPSRLILLSHFSSLPSKSSPVLQWLQYESINFPHLLQHTRTSLANAYVIRKALIRKHYLSTTVAHWVVKHPESVLARHVKPSVEFEVDYAEFLDEALVEAWELRESWGRGGEWWILKPGMSERGQGIRLFASEEELTSIFEGWDPESDDEEEDGDGDGDGDVRSDAGSTGESEKIGSSAEEKAGEGGGIVTSHLRHFVAQPYIHPPLLLCPPSAAQEQELRKFHIRTYVLATGALQVYVYRPMLALFAARAYIPPSEANLQDNPEEALRAHLTNTCLQETGEREGSVALFWNLPEEIPEQPSFTPALSADPHWKDTVFAQICAVTSEVFEAAARGMSIHFQPLPNAFELFGLDFMVGVERDGELRTWLLEVNAFPDFRQTGEECKGMVEGLMDGVVRVAVAPFFGDGKREGESGAEGLVQVLDMDLGRR
ncbi:TTL-domain-containing protein [Bimuria novae-zelandiae CBS 107.79]|uniref:TTL-domain-containing protein n=1 Tax=Bimuria novae-zelandiae CBS 107.79 TaxID=1447943 RepID=A0A6A5VN57_9PLEO|nr:TTL-domain-containing protein [Bimuria novae-zelandiae CBS 107.79]